MFTVIYVLLPAINGGLSYLVLGRVLSRRQWLCIAVVVAGLACSTPLAEEVSLLGCWGSLLGLGGTLMNSLQYVVTERLLKSPGASSPGALSAASGLNDLLLLSPWLLFYSLPNLDPLLFKPVADKALLSGSTVALLWLLLVFANGAHMSSAFTLLRLSDSVTLTMLQGVRVVLVFALTGALFCDDDAAHHCLSAQKAAGSMVVLAGVLLYARNTAVLTKHVGGRLGVTSSSSSSSSSSGILAGPGRNESEQERHDRLEKIDAEAPRTSLRSKVYLVPPQLPPWTDPLSASTSTS
jgi:drug/metabolite transporter (DMT)-like permease